jgi:hypothetical protein
LRALIAVPTVQLVLVALLVKHALAATVTGFPGRNGCDGRTGAALARNLVALSVEYFKGLN